MRTLWQVENNEYCKRVLRKHWPRVRRFGDVCGVDWRTVPPVDVVCGGFPCQPVSNAGKRLAQDDELWLWPEVARCLRDLGERPRWVVLENVAALASRGLGDVLRDLAALGYDAEWSCVSAARVGARHRRDRIWIVAYSNSDTRPTKRGERPHAAGEGTLRGDQRGRGAGDAPRRKEPVFGAGEDPRSAEPEIVAYSDGWRQPGEREPEHVDEPGARRDLAHRRDPRGSRRGPRIFTRRAYTRLESIRKTRGVELWGKDPATIPKSGVGRVAHGVPNRAHRLRGLGNAVVPLIPEWIGGLIAEAERNG